MMLLCTIGKRPALTAVKWLVHCLTKQTSKTQTLHEKTTVKTRIQEPIMKSNTVWYDFTGAEARRQLSPESPQTEAARPTACRVS